MESGIERFAVRLNEAVEQAESLVDSTHETLIQALKADAAAGEPNPTPGCNKALSEHSVAYSTWSALLDVQQMLADEVGVRIASMGSA